MNSKSVFSFTILLSSVLWFVDARSNGAPAEACVEIEPMHSPYNRSTLTIRYGLDLSDFPNRTYIPGRGYTITMSPTTGVAFKGFMIQARRLVDDSPVGMFAFDGMNFQTQCVGNPVPYSCFHCKYSKLYPPQTSATHTNNNSKEMVTLSWTAPPAQTGNIYFRYAFVESFDTFWSRITSQILQETNSPFSSAFGSATVMVTPTATIPTATTSTRRLPMFTIANTGGEGGAAAGLLASSMMILSLTVLLIVTN